MQIWAGDIVVESECVVLQRSSPLLIVTVYEVAMQVKRGHLRMHLFCESFLSKSWELPEHGIQFSQPAEQGWRPGLW